MKFFNPDNLYQILSNLTSNTNLFVAFSGGLDSQVLLHVLAQIKKNQTEFSLTAIHVNHSLSEHAKSWEQHCQAICNELKVPLIIKQVDAKIKIAALSPEETARNLRYQVFAEILPKDAVLLTAHQADDQAETLLLQLFRGAGPKGMAAMLPKTKFAAGFLLRPLLAFTRNDLMQYAKKHNLKWIEDTSNVDLKYSRNFLRHEILPQIKTRWPGVTTVLNRSSQHFAESEELLETLALQDLLQVQGSVEHTLSVNKLLALDAARIRNVIRYWLSQLKLPLPSSAKVEQILKTVLRSKPDTSPKVLWHGAELHRFDNNIYAFFPLPKHDNKIILSWDLTKPLKLPANLGTLHAGSNNDLKDFDVTKISVRFRQGGETLMLSGRKGTHSLKKLMQEWRVPPWLRDRIPLIYYDEKIVAVVGFSDHYSLKK